MTKQLPIGDGNKKYKTNRSGTIFNRMREYIAYAGVLILGQSGTPIGEVVIQVKEAVLDC